MLKVFRYPGHYMKSISRKYIATLKINAWPQLSGETYPRLQHKSSCTDTQQAENTELQHKTIRMLLHKAGWVWCFCEQVGVSKDAEVLLRPETWGFKETQVGHFLHLHLQRKHKAFSHECNNTAELCLQFIIMLFLLLCLLTECLLYCTVHLYWFFYF